MMMEDMVGYLKDATMVRLIAEEKLNEKSVMEINMDDLDFVAFFSYFYIFQSGGANLEDRRQLLIRS